MQQTRQSVQQMTRGVVKHGLCFLFTFFSIAITFANPTGGIVTHGGAVISQPTSNTTLINQSTPKAIIQWRSFNINSNEKTHFQQPAGGIVLNRISAQMGVSQIYGQLTATGQVILINQAGIHFGPNAVVNVGGIIASTSDISDSNFLAGRYIFNQPSPYAGSIINEGTIRAAQYGLVALIGTGVRNDGMIEAKLGSVALGSGNKFTIDLYGDQLVNFAVDEAGSSAGVDYNKQKLTNGVANNGTIFADGGRVIISARAAQNVVDNVINMQGIIQTKAVYQRGGEIILAGDGGTVRVSGKMNVSGRGYAQRAGKIKIASQKVIVDSSAQLDADGYSAGGEILIGGDKQGKNITLFNSKQTLANAQEATVMPGAWINADAISQGDGGKIIVWSDEKTTYGGLLSAQGGSLGGNGGFAEISGKMKLVFYGKVDLLAPHGLTGTLLLDPENLTIQAAGATNASTFGSTYVSNQSDSILTVADLQAALASSNVLVQTGSLGNQAGDITVASSFSWANANTLTLSAYRNIVINSGITISNSANGSLILHSDNTGTGTGTVTNSGSISISGTGKIDIFYNPASYTSPITYTNSAGASPATLTAYMLVNNPTNLSDIRNNLSGNYALGRSIDMTSVASFTPVGSFSQPFTGKFNGDSYTIRNLTINTASGMLGGVTVDGVGLFGVTNNATVQNVSLINVNVNNTGLSAIGGGIGSTTGGLIGYARGSTAVSKVYVSGNVAYSNTGLGVASNIGGLVGYSEASTTIDQVQASVSVSSAAQVNGLVGAISRVGGLIGFNQGTITNAAVSGTVAVGGLLDLLGSIGGLAGSNGGAINTSYSVVSSITGSLVALSAKGGLIGNNTGTINNNYWNSTLLAGFNTCGVGTCANAGRTTVQMQTQSTYTGFNFTNTWGINSTNNGKYPYLLSFAPRVISGTLPSTGGSINLYNNGSLVNSQVIGAGTSTFTFSVDYGTISDSDALLLYLSGYSTTNNLVAIAPLANGSLTNLDLTANNQLTMGASNIGSLTNNLLSAAKGALSTTDLLFSTSGNNLIIGTATHPSVNVTTSAQTSYSLDGTLSYTGGGSGNLVFNGPVSISGGTSITSLGNQTYASTVSLNSNNAVFSGAVLSLQNVELGSSRVLILDTSALTSQILGLVSGTGGLTKLGTGTLSLTAANTYSGSTTLTNGTLNVGNNNTLGTNKSK